MGLSIVGNFWKYLITHNCINKHIILNGRLFLSMCVCMYVCMHALTANGSQLDAINNLKMAIGLILKHEKITIWMLNTHKKGKTHHLHVNFHSILAFFLNFFHIFLSFYCFYASMHFILHFFTLPNFNAKLEQQQQQQQL